MPFIAKPRARSPGLRPGLGLCLCICVLASLFGPALQASEAETERAQLGQARQEIEARFARESQVCEARFFVTSCLDEARARKQADLRPLQAREDALNTAERRARAQAQREDVLRRQREFAGDEARRRTETLLAPAPAASQAMPEPRSARQPAADWRERELQKAAVEERAARDAQQRRQQAQEREQQFKTRQAQAEARNTQREQERGTQAAPLALPKPTAADLAAAAHAASAARH